MKENLFSIIGPAKAYNPYCVESLGTCQRLYPGQEIFFSPDEPTQIPFPAVRVVPSGPAGPSFKRDLCMNLAKGEILAFLDDDAFPAPGWLEAAAEIFEDPSVGAVGGPAVTPSGDSLSRWGSGLVYSSMMAGGTYAYRYIPLASRLVDDYPTCNLLVRKEVMKAAGGFDTGFWPGEDTVACLKIVHQLKKKIVYDPRVMVYHHRRDLYSGHLRQVSSYALHRGYFVKKFPQTSLRFSYFLPSILLAGLAAGWLPALFWKPWLGVWGAGALLYLLAAVVESIRVQRQAPPLRRGLSLGLLVSSGIVATHLVYGWKFMVGLLSSSLFDEKISTGGVQAGSANQ